MAETGLGALIGWGLGAYGEKPTVPQLAKIDPNQVQQQTVAGNLASFKDIAGLAAGVNTFNQDQLEALIDRALPGARQQIQSNIGSQLRGEIPADVAANVRNLTAARAQAGGYSGSGMSGNLTARELGLTSLNLINQGLSSAESWLKTATAPQMDASSMFFTPQQRLAFSQQQQSMQFQRDLMAAGVAAAPDPSMAALASGFDNDLAAIRTAALSYAGMMAGGMGGGGSGAAPKSFASPQAMAGSFGSLGGSAF